MYSIHTSTPVAPPIFPSHFCKYQWNIGSVCPYISFAIIMIFYVHDCTITMFTKIELPKGEWWHIKLDMTINDLLNVSQSYSFLDYFFQSLRGCSFDDGQQCQHFCFWTSLSCIISANTFTQANMRPNSYCII